MSLLAGPRLDPYLFFSPAAPMPIVQGSTFDLTIGSIIGQNGRPMPGPFKLKPGNIVQVVSREIFSLPCNVTGQATYKTSLTKVGIWALTIGIVDPGWTGPLTTTLLNFSKVDYSIFVGMQFMRVSVFEHEPVGKDKLRPCTSLPAYMQDAKDKAMTTFPSTFMDKDEIAGQAGNKAVRTLIVRVLAVAGVITLISGSAVYFMNNVHVQVALFNEKEVQQLEARMGSLEAQLRKSQSSAPVHNDNGAKPRP